MQLRPCCKILPPFQKKSCIIFESLLLKILINQHAGFLHDKDSFWTCLFGGTIVFVEERSMSLLWHKKWGVVKWRRWKNIQKWANGSETLGKINQMQFRATSFWQVACSLHAFCMHTCQDWVSQKWIYFDECSWCTHHLSVLQLPIDRSACIFSSWSPECVPPVKIVCSACNLKVQLICDLPDPLPYAGFFMKRRK